MSRWVRAVSAKDVPPGHCRGLSLEGREVGLFNVGGEFFAMGNVCPHRGAPLTDGRMEGDRIVCPWHGWEFNVKSGGLAMDPQRCQLTYPVNNRDGIVFVDMEPAS